MSTIVHLLRIAAKIESVSGLQKVQKERSLSRSKDNSGNVFTFTRNIPKRVSELENGGSIYWIIKKYIRVRQSIIGIEKLENDEGRRYCRIVLSSSLIPVVPRRHRVFQGWRYLKNEEVPLDLDINEVNSLQIPVKISNQLRELGLI